MTGSLDGHNEPESDIAPHNSRTEKHPVKEAISDGLTGLRTQRSFMEALEGEGRRSKRTGHQFCVILVRLDMIKQTGDRVGEPERDKVLQTVAALLDGRLRQPNVVARYGEGEFAILTPETNAQQAEILAERLRAALQADEFLRRHGVTASFGIATFPHHNLTVEEILGLAQSGASLAQHHHGNCVKRALLSPCRRD